MMPTPSKARSRPLFRSTYSCCCATGTTESCFWPVLGRWRQVVATKLKIPMGSQRLFFGDTLLEDGDGSGKAKDLSEWGISTGSIVRLERLVD